MAKGTKKTSGGRRFAMAVVLFLILCGVLLVITGGGAGGTPDVDEAAESDVWKAYKSADEAERAINEGNMGDAKKEVRRTKDLLRRVVEED